MDANPPVVDEALENARIPAGFVILGQLLAHDITADRSLLARHAVAGELTNSRTPRLDLFGMADLVVFAGTAGASR